MTQNWKAAIKRHTGLDYREAVARLAAKGHSKNATADLLGIGRKTFYAHQLAQYGTWRDPWFTLEAINGRLAGNQTLRDRSHLERFDRERTRRAQHTVRGQTGTLEQLTQHFAAASYTTVRERIGRGWSVEEALTTPAQHKFNPRRLGEHRLRGTL